MSTDLDTFYDASTSSVFDSTVVSDESKTISATEEDTVIAISYLPMKRNAALHEKFMMNEFHKHTMSKVTDLLDTCIKQDSEGSGKFVEFKNKFSSILNSLPESIFKDSVEDDYSNPAWVRVYGFHPTKDEALAHITKLGKRNNVHIYSVAKCGNWVAAPTYNAVVDGKPTLLFGNNALNSYFKDKAGYDNMTSDIEPIEGKMKMSIAEVAEGESIEKALNRTWETKDSPVSDQIEPEVSEALPDYI